MSPNESTDLFLTILSLVRFIITEICIIGYFTLIYIYSLAFNIYFIILKS